MDVIIRDAMPDDIELIAEFNRRMALETEIKTLNPAVARQGVAQLLARPELGRYFVACSNLSQSSGGRDEDGSMEVGVVGQCMITYEWSDWRAGLFWWIQSVYVQPDFRGRGVFRAIFQHVASLARASRDVCGLRLYVEHNNSGAISTYERLGMVPSGHTMFEIDWSAEIS